MAGFLPGLGRGGMTHSLEVTEQGVEGLGDARDGVRLMEMDGRNADGPAVAIAGGEEALDADLSSRGEVMVNMRQVDKQLLNHRGTIYHELIVGMMD